MNKNVDRSSLKEKTERKISILDSLENFSLGYFPADLHSVK